MTKIITSGEGGQPPPASGRSAYLEAFIQNLRQMKQSGKGVRWEDFSFDLSQQLTRDIPGNLSDLVIEERDES